MGNFKEEFRDLGTTHIPCVHQKENDWFFFDETGEEIGPYETEKKCRQVLDQYVYSILTA